MFDALKKKLSSLFTKKEEKPKKSSKKTSKKEKKKSSKKESKKASKKEVKIKKNKLSAKKESDIPKPSEIKEPEDNEDQNEDLEKEIEEQEEEVEEPIKEEKQESSFFKSLFKKFTGTKITQEHFDEIFMELEITLLENNVALEVVDKIRENLSKSIIGLEISKSDIENKILQSLKDSILSVLIEPPNLIEQIKSKKDKPFVILFFGINGTGKTTSIAKLAHKLQKEKLSVVLAAGDTFRSASIEQLKVHADKLSVPLIAHDYNTDPAAVAFDAISYAKKNKIDVVLIDTAGRMYTKSNLMKEMEKIIRVSKPDLKIFVGESITGNDAVDQAKTFNETAGIDGIILSKADIDEKAGTILSVSYVTNKPIYFLGTGQEYSDLLSFTKKEVLKNLGLE